MSGSLSAPQRPDSKFTLKQIAAFCFKPSLTEDGDPTDLQICKACGKARKYTLNTGYTNLVSHVKSDHTRFEMEMGDASVAATGSLLPWVRQKASNRLPDGTLNCLWCVATQEAVTKAVEKRIGEEMPDKFGLLLDGWSHGTKYYLENCAVNKHLARLMGGPLMGCASHRINIAVRTLLEPHEAEPEQVQSLMKRLRTLTQAAKLRPKSSDIVTAPDFENGVVKFLRGAAAAATEETTNVGNADGIFKRWKVQDNASAYVQLNAIPPTSNAAERLFSMA
ncbi:hypothetical protein PHMEG_00017365 [Phytophthora megakarya]|uniref:BED-type domain-containing protein n=1 Tax=Phytophthora megakarya TaxID=4795 RepID=A0A225VYK8_9STRA|nr:hypothetical protein PHMEG_00017365 [Phytophthora megakarya]